VIAVERQSAYAEDAPAEGDAPVSDTPPENADAPPAAASEVPPASSAPAAAAPAPNPATQSPPAPLASPTTYVVVQGDTIYSIARKHGVSVDAILWANKMTDPNVVRVGQKLIIPPASGKLHVVKDGDTLDSLSQTYGVSKAGIAVVNGLAENATLTAGQRLLIPSSLRPPATDPTFSPAQLVAASNAEPVPVSAPSGPATGSPVPPLISSIAPLIQSPGVLSPSSSTTSAVRPSGPTVSITNRTITKLAWPFTVKPPTSGVSQGFRPGHTGIDIYAPAGTSIGACAAGTVKLAEKDPPGFTGYGWIVIVDHGDGFTTWYAHLGSFAVKVEDRVETGQKIGTVGMTGRTTGPHLHLETRINTSPFDPRLALPSL
jgi:murein DD-endopeptidase MepM/ murein hydrolase activator NlpD